ncbi:MAG: hypothetical protein GY856_50185 [bacterium]|nr:hypothetical protein [bacterium]
MKAEPKELPLRLVAQLRSPHVVADDVVREELATLLPETELAGAWAALLGLERRTGREGLAAVEATTILPVVAPAEPGEPRFPVSAEDLELAALIASPATIPDDVIRPQLCDVLARSPLGPAMWKVREIEWAVAVPPVFPEPLPGIAALDRWRIAGELVDELLGLPGEDRAAAAECHRYRSSLVVHQLLDRCREQRFEKIQGYLEAANLAVALSESIFSDAGTDWRRSRGLHALALVISANAHKMLGEFHATRSRLAAGDAAIIGEQDAPLQALYYGHKASALIYMRRLKEAREASEKATRSYRRAKDRNGVVKQLMHDSFIDFAAGELTLESVERLARAEKMPDPFREPLLGPSVLLSLAWYQAELGLAGEAQATWHRIPPFRERILELRRKAVLGRIHQESMHLQSAIANYSEATQGMASIGHCDTEYYRLFLAGALQAAGRHGEATAEALQAARFFASAGVDCVASVAVTILGQAAMGAVETATIAALIKAVEASPPGLATSRRDRLQVQTSLSTSSV